jgi:fructose-1-phosphate kinase PfkB-like protein
MPSIGDLEGILIDDAENADVRKVADELNELGAKCLLIKLGAKGMYYRNPGAAFFRTIEKKLKVVSPYMENWENREGFAEAVKPKKNISGLGAGDVAIAAYLAAIMHTQNFDETIALALAEGALCLGDVSATGGLKPFGELTDVFELF